MKLNCRPGDLAIVLGNSRVVKEPTAMMVVTVVRLAPLGDFALPDGHDAVCSVPGSWVIEFPRPLHVRCASGKWAPRAHGVCVDSRLRPITPPPGTVTDEEVTQLYAPQVKEHA